jgi:hypothetical protein
MPERDAKILQNLKKGSYGNAPETPADKPAVSVSAQAATEQKPESEPVAASSDGLDEMNREQLLKFAEDLEIKIHGRTGDERIREIIREHTK